MSAVNQYKQRRQPEVNRLIQQNVLFWGSHTDRQFRLEVK